MLSHLYTYSDVSDQTSIQLELEINLSLEPGFFGQQLIPRSAFIEYGTSTLNDAIALLQIAIDQILTGRFPNCPRWHPTPERLQLWIRYGMKQWKIKQNNVDIC